MKLGEIAYSQQDDDDSADAGDNDDNANDDDSGVVDAEFTEVDDSDDKKSASS